MAITAVGGKGVAIAAATSLTRDPATDVPTLDVGDFMAAQITMLADETADIASSSGWTKHASIYNSFGYSVHVFSKTREQGETSYGWTWGGNSLAVTWTVAVLRAAPKRLNVVDVDQQEDEGGNTNAPWGVVDTQAGGAILGFWASTTNDGGANQSPTNFTEFSSDYFATPHFASVGACRNLSPSVPSHDVPDKTVGGTQREVNTLISVAEGGPIFPASGGMAGQLLPCAIC